MTTTYFLEWTTTDEDAARRDREAPPEWARTVCVKCRREIEQDDLDKPVCPHCGFDGEV